jgi:ubiquinone biosynthesis protein Coq4
MYEGKLRTSLGRSILNRMPDALERTLAPVRLGQVALAFSRIVRDPSRLDEVFALADGLATKDTLQPLVDAFAAFPEGARSLTEMPRLGRLTLPELRAYAAGTLGHAFAAHLDRNGLDPASLPVRPASDPYAYVQAHLYETHDLWHTLTGFGADVAGELGLQGFYIAQLPSKLACMIVAAGFANCALFAFDDRERRMGAIVDGWVMGRRARPIFGVDWQPLLAQPLAEVRAEFGIVPTALVPGTA